MTHSLPLRASGSRKKTEAARGEVATRLAVLGGGPEQAVLLSSRNPEAISEEVAGALAYVL